MLLKRPYFLVVQALLLVQETPMTEFNATLAQALAYGDPQLATPPTSPRPTPVIGSRFGLGRYRVAPLALIKHRSQQRIRYNNFVHDACTDGRGVEHIK